MVAAFLPLVKSEKILQYRHSALICRPALVRVWSKCRMAKLSMIGQRVRRRMADLDIRTIKELEEKAGLPRDTIRHLISGRTVSVRSNKLPRLAEALKMSVEELVHGGPAGGAEVATLMPMAAQDQPSAQIGRVRFDAQTLPAFGASDGDPRWMVASTDNMAPTIAPGDVVLVDSSVKAVQADGIYCVVSATGAITFRRIQISSVSGRITLANDNPKYAPETQIKPDSISVAGRVIGCYRRL
jgi:SOS-response transcriptional repressor LexA